ncbi:MAG: hypothetical protein E6931_04780 [Clostridium botulinum]|nr:hypothetical protein [Clostridium botulinum]
MKNNLYSYVKSPKLGDKSSMEYFISKNIYYIENNVYCGYN